MKLDSKSWRIGQQFLYVKILKYLQVIRFQNVYYAYFTSDRLLIFASINLYLPYVMLVTLTILLIQQYSHQQTVNALIPETRTLPLLNHTSIILTDKTLKLELFATGLKKPTNLVFLNSGDALVLEKQNGTVRRIVNGNVIPEPVLDVNVANYDTRGMLGIAVAKNETVGKQYVFLYYTEAKDGQGDGKDKCISPSKCISGYLPNGNRLYRFELSQDGSKLINPKLIFSWPPLKRADHNGGELIVGPRNDLFLSVGHGSKGTSLVTNNKINPRPIDGGSGILVFNHNGGPAFGNGIIGHTTPLNRYYAYGIRNSFGMDFDPVTGKLWDTENGPTFGDEINLVKPGFNSGWKKIQGVWEVIRSNTGEGGSAAGNVSTSPEANLVDFNGTGMYRSPEFTWNQTVGVTAIKFLNSSKYGKEYQNDIFVGSANNNGDLFHFDLNSNRTGLDLKGTLVDKIANNYGQLKAVTFGKNFGIISDLAVGPDGYLYIVSLSNGEIYRLIPKASPN